MTRYFVCQVPLKAWKMFRKAGPAVMTKRAGMMQKDHGEKHLDRCLLGLFLSQQVPPHSHVGGLVPQDRTDGHAEYISLLESEDEGADLTDAGTDIQGSPVRRPCSSRRASHRACGRILRTRPRHHRDATGQGLLETETRLHTDDEEVEDIGQLLADRQLTIGDHAVEPGIGSDHPGQSDQNEYDGQIETADRCVLPCDVPEMGTAATDRT